MLEHGAIKAGVSSGSVEQSEGWISGALNLPGSPNDSSRFTNSSTK